MSTTGSRLHSTRVAILAGGQSARFGGDKALATVPGTDIPFLQRIIDTARLVTDDIVVIAPVRPAYLRFSAILIPDRYPREGPAGGVVTALESTPSEQLIVLSCDQPLISPDDLIALLATVRTEPAAAFKRGGHQIQPLPCAFQVAECLRPASDAFASGTRSLSALLAACDVAGIEGIDDESSQMRRLVDVDSIADLDRLAQGMAGEVDD